MVQEIELPDGRIAEFPDNMSREQIGVVLRKQFPKEKTETFKKERRDKFRAREEALRAEESERNRRSNLLSVIGVDSNDVEPGSVLDAGANFGAGTVLGVGQAFANLPGIENERDLIQRNLAQDEFARAGFAGGEAGATTLGLLGIGAGAPSAALRGSTLLRGTPRLLIDAVPGFAGQGARAAVSAGQKALSALDPVTLARLSLGGPGRRGLATLGLLGNEALQTFGVDIPFVPSLRDIPEGVRSLLN